MNGRYTRCPDCGQKKVIFTLRAGGEDGYYCTRKNYVMDGNSLETKAVLHAIGANNFEPDAAG